MRVVIIGNGVAGITCAMTVRKGDPAAEITVISGETEYFFSRTALMYSYMDQLTRRDLEPYERSEYRRQNIQLVKGWMVDCDTQTQHVVLDDGQRIPYDKLVYAVGAKANIFPWKGIDNVKDGLVHFVSMQDLESCERLTPSTQRAVVIGGGLIGIELVECLRHHGVNVTFLVREPYYWPMALGEEEATFVAEEIRHHGVDLRLREEMTEVEVDSSGRVAFVHTNTGERIPCQMLGITAGVRPNIDLLKQFSRPPELGRGIVVNEYLEAPQPNVYAAGDCAEIHMPGQERPLTELIWYSAKRQGAHVARNILGDRQVYTPPTFFNSSKFFEIEYTTVGEVETLPEGTPTLYRKMPGQPISQRVTFNDRQEVLGFNMLGSRWNHELLEDWVNEGRTLDYVKQNLHQAQYDVEFGQVKLDRMEEQIIPLKKFQ
ncbi:MAG: NAD(P)/FAD-dependent oxidoreductase [Deltaproteobacteria bacterium]|nr:MAG: NAD(P)/FAD-dependent oxidoreductase [Deltaproteobacteria bacterium]